MNKMGKAGILTRKLAECESITNYSKVIGFNEGPKKNGKVVTLHFENGSSQEYTESELFEVNGIETASVPSGESVRITESIPTIWKTLVGKAFHIRKDGKIMYQGIIQAEVYPKIFLISCFSCLDSEYTGKRLITLEKILENDGKSGLMNGWFFYENVEYMNEDYTFENRVDVSVVTLGKQVSVE